MTKEPRTANISIYLKSPIELESIISFEQPFRQCDPDKVTISDTTIDIQYKRSSNLGPKRAFNKTRIAYMQSTVLALACLETSQNPIEFDSAVFSIDQKRQINLKIPEELIALKNIKPLAKFPQKVIERSFGKGKMAKHFRISLSYSWAASMAYSQEERLRLLWGSFNALYRFFYQKQNHNQNELRMLDATSDLFIREKVLDRAIVAFGQEIGSLNFKKFVKWKLITGARCRALSIKDKDRFLDDKAKRLASMDRETLLYMRDCGCADAESKKRLKDEIDKALANCKCKTDPTRKTTMLLCRYIYIFRCDSVHANIEYPIFKPEKEREKQIMGDLLEAAIIDYSEWLSSN